MSGIPANGFHAKLAKFAKEAIKRVRLSVETVGMSPGSSPISTSRMLVGLLTPKAVDY
jgi:hypothetical protein